MRYPYMSFEDETEVTHSGFHEDGTVDVYIETPTEGGFKSATCRLPDYRWTNDGYDDDELKYWKHYVAQNAHLMMEFANEGGFAHAAAV